MRVVVADDAVILREGLARLLRDRGHVRLLLLSCQLMLLGCGVPLARRAVELGFTVFPQTAE